MAQQTEHRELNGRASAGPRFRREQAADGPSDVTGRSWVAALKRSVRDSRRTT